MRSQELQEDLTILADYIQSLEIGGRTILVTGVTGLIGSLITKGIIEYNKKNERKICVIGMARDPQKVRKVFIDEYEGEEEIPQVCFCYQDVCERIPRDMVCDYIIHTANSTASQFFITNPVDVMDSIYTGTKQVLEFGKDKNVKAVVYLSSMEVFGKVNKEEPVKESQLGYLDIQNVRSCYSEGKRLAECMCKCYAEQYGVPVKVARLAQTFGAGVLENENRVFAQFARSAIKGEDIVLHTTGQSVGNYCYTTDVIKAIFLLLKKGDKGEVYTVVNEETTRSIADMAQMVAKEISGGKSKVVFDIPDENKFGYAPETKMILSSKKLRSLGWKPERCLLEMYERMIPSIK